METPNNELDAVVDYVNKKYSTNLEEHPKGEGGHVAFIKADGRSSHAFGMLSGEGKNSRFLPHQLTHSDEIFTHVEGARVATLAIDLKTGIMKVVLVAKGNPVKIEKGWIQAEFMVPSNKPDKIMGDFGLLVMEVTPPYQDNQNEFWIDRYDEMVENLRSNERVAIQNALHGNVSDLLKLADNG